MVGRQDEPLEGQSLPFLDKIHFPLIISQNINSYIYRSPLCRGGGSYVSRMNFKTYCYSNFTQLNKECHRLILDCDTFEHCTPLGIHYRMLSKHGGKWRDGKGEKHCQFSFL